MQHAAVADLLVHLGFIEVDRAARFGLGAEQRRAGIGEQRGRVRAVVRKHRDAGGDAGAQRPAVDLEFARHRFRELLAQRLAGLGLLAVDDQAELVAGQARHDAAARGDLQPPRHLDQELVAARVSEHVVDFLQAIEIDAQHGEFLAGAGAGLDHLGQRLQERGAVRQVGEAVVIGHMRHARFGLAAVGDVLVGLDQILRIAGLVQHRHAPRQEQPQAVLGRDRMLLGQQAALLDGRGVARDDQLGLALIEDVGGRQPDHLLAPAVEDLFRAAVGEQIASVADALDDQRHRDVVDHELEEFLGVLQLLRQRAPLGDVVEQRDQEFRAAVFVARDDAVGGEHAPLAAALDQQLAAVMAVLRQQRGLVGRLDIGRGLGLEDLVGAAADDVVAREAGEALERLVGEDVAAVVDALGGDADRHVVEHQFQELLGRGELPRQLALIGGILMGCDRAAVRQPEMLDQDRPAVRQFGDQSFRTLSRAHRTRRRCSRACRARVRSSSSCLPVMPGGRSERCRP